LGALPQAFLDGFSWKKWVRNIRMGINSFYLKVYNYTEVKRIMAARKFSYRYLPCIFVGWDNTARRNKKGIIILNQNTNDFRDSLINAKDVVANHPVEEQFVFINAWNEWAEGNYLEPCSKHGFDFLNVVREVFRN